MTNFEAELNPQQLQAVRHTNGPLLIIAGAGSGKTRVLTYRIAHLLEMGAAPTEILAITFTNKAAREMRDRVESLVGTTDGMWISTFHSACVRMLRRNGQLVNCLPGFSIYDDQDQLVVIRACLRELDLDDKKYHPRAVLSAISKAKNMLQGPEEFGSEAKELYSRRVAEVYKLYAAKLRTNNALDFDDLLNKTLELLLEHPPVLDHYRKRFRYVHVDEYQDTNLAQYHLVKLITQESRNLCVVGDDDQSIYGWRGADIRNIMEFQKDFPEAKVVKLEQNYRSTQTILSAANSVIKHNATRMDKELWTEGAKGDKIRFAAAGDEREEAAWICEHIRRLNAKRKVPYAQIAVLYRMHAQSRVLEEMLMRAGIPYRVYGGTRFYDRKEIKDALAYLRLMINPDDDVALKRIINTPKRAIGDATVAMLEEQADNLQSPLYQALVNLPDTLGSRPRKCVESFRDMMEGLNQKRKTMPLGEFVALMLDETGLIKEYAESADEDMLAKRDNLLEFLGAVNEFEKKSEDPSLEAYLENVALVTDLDMQEDAPQYVTLMTLHSAKGLEYRAVFIAGLEDGLLPSMRAKSEGEARLEEERRLCYVGITRAREFLYLTRARHRAIFNQAAHNQPSPFLAEIPKELISDEWGTAMRKHFGPEKKAPEPPRPTKQPPKMGFGIPGMGMDPGKIPGVRKGLIASLAPRPEPTEIFKKGDKVLHKKFGSGTVVETTGTGADSRVSIQFTAYGEKEFAVAIAPIVKVE